MGAAIEETALCVAVRETLDTFLHEHEGVEYAELVVVQDGPLSIRIEVDGIACKLALLTAGELPPKDRAFAGLAAERARQVDVEGRTAEHDDAYSEHELFLAGGCYLDFATGERDEHLPPRAWPWDRKWWKPKNVERDLIRAGALFQAEIDRIERRELGRTASVKDRQIRFSAAQDLQKVVRRLALIYRDRDERAGFERNVA